MKNPILNAALFDALSLLESCTNDIYAFRTHSDVGNFYPELDAIIKNLETEYDKLAQLVEVCDE